MKKVLFASTALVAFSGAASAEVLLSGQAELGIYNNERLQSTPDADGNFSPNENASSFFTDLDVTFTMSGETDGGLTFGANIDLDEGGDGAPFEDAARQGGEAIFVSGGFGTLTGGDTDGALDWALTEVAFNSGSLNDDETIHAGFNNNRGLDGLYDGQIMRYDYSVGGFGVGISAELDDDDADDGDDVYGIGLKYTLDLGGTAIALGGGYQTAKVNGIDLDTYGMTANASFLGSFTGGINYMHFKNHVASATIADGNFSNVLGGAGSLQGGRLLTDGDDSDAIGVGVGYSSGAISVSANYGQFDSDDNRIGKIKGYGLTAGYDLGGGAALRVGYGHSDYGDVDLNGGAAGGEVDDADTVSFGLSMAF